MVRPRRQMLEAIERGNVAEIKRLVRSHGLSNTWKSSQGSFLLTKALETDQREIARFLLDCGASAACDSIKVVYEDSPLHLACRRGYQDIAELCLQKGADVNQMDHRQRTPLDCSKDAATARILLQNGANARDKSGRNKLYLRLKYILRDTQNSEAALDWLKLIDDHGGLMNIVDQSEDWCDLVKYASSRFLRELLKRGLSAGAQSRHGSYLIHDCARQGQVEKLKLLTEFGADVNARDSHGSTALHAAASSHPSRGLYEVMEFLVQCNPGVDVNQKDNDSCTALYYAIRGANISIAKLLLEHGADPNIRGPLGTTPLIMACKRGADSTKLLLDHGAEVNARDSDGSTALHVAVRHYPDECHLAESPWSELNREWRAQDSPYQVVEYLVQCDRAIDVNQKDNESYTALHYAILAGKVNIAKLLLAHGADPNIRGPSGITPLVMACRKDADLTKILLEHGADVLALMADGDTVLNKTGRWSPSIIIDHLLDHGLLTELSDRDGNSALHIVCRNYGSAECVEKLLNNGLDSNLRNKKGETSLHMATASRQTNIVEILIDRGADVSACTTEGLTALHVAADYQHSEEKDYGSGIELIGLLLRKSANVNAADVSGKTPLHYAVVKRATRDIALLLESGADMDAEDHEGVTPLYLAIELDRADVVGLFLDRGIDPAFRFRDGTTPIHLAARGRGYSLRLLCKHAQRLGIDIDCLDANGETPLFNALIYSMFLCNSEVRLLLEMGSDIDHVFWIDKDICCDWFSTKRHKLWSIERFRQLAIKLSVARLLPSSGAHSGYERESDVSVYRDEPSVPDYEEELERLKKLMILGSMSLYDFLHDENRLTAKAISQVKHSLSDMMADFPNYRGLVESKIKIDLAYGETLRVATRRLGLYTSRSPSLRHLIIPEEIITRILHLFTHGELILLNRN